MAKKKTHGSATLKGLVMLAVAVGVPYYIATRTDLPQRADDYLVERRILHSDDYVWGGGDAPGWSGARDAADVLDRSPPGIPLQDAGVMPATYAAAEGGAANSGVYRTDGSTAVTVQVDRFTGIERRLRELGAVYFVLETQGTETPKYRFLCRTALAGNQRVSQKFEASRSSALEAMEDVLRQAERWHSEW